MDKQLSYRMQIFAQIVRSGSMTAAADVLNLTKSGMSQHMRQLEEALGTQLMKRTTRRLQLTESGQSFYQRCCELEQLLSTTIDELQTTSESVAGQVIITMPEAFAESVVVPAVANMKRVYPDLQFQLLVDDRQLDLLEHNIDLAIRVGRMSDSSFKARKIGSTREYWYTGYDDEDKRSEIILPWQKSSSDRISVNRLSAAAHLIMCGAGKAKLPDFYAERYCREHRMQLVPDQVTPRGTPVYAVHAYQRELPVRVKIVLEEIERLMNS